MTYKLIALDIDGTIRGPNREISDRTRRVIDRVIEAGAVVTVATGRMFESARMSTVALDLRSPIISYQGAHVADPVTGDVLWHLPLTERQALEALDALDGWPGDVAVYLGDDVYVGEMTPWARAYSERNRRTCWWSTTCGTWPGAAPPGCWPWETNLRYTTWSAG